MLKDGAHRGVNETLEKPGDFEMGLYGLVVYNENGNAGPGGLRSRPETCAVGILSVLCKGIGTYLVETIKSRCSTLPKRLFNWPVTL